MATEIERKFLVVGDGWRSGATAVRIRQGYLHVAETLSVRVRTLGDRAFLTIKSGQLGPVRGEYEYPIPVADAAEMLDRLCPPPLIDKTRYSLDYAGRTWVVDVFAADNAGLVVAEVELEAADAAVTLPPWVGREVTDDGRYLNVNLISHPYQTWPPEDRATAYSCKT